MNLWSDQFFGEKYWSWETKFQSSFGIGSILHLSWFFMLPPLPPTAFRSPQIAYSTLPPKIIQFLEFFFNQTVQKSVSFQIKKNWSKSDKNCPSYCTLTDIILEKKTCENPPSKFTLCFWAPCIPLLSTNDKICIGIDRSSIIHEE